MPLVAPDLTHPVQVRGGAHRSITVASSVTDITNAKTSAPPTLRAPSSSARGIAPNNPGQPQRVPRQAGRHTLMSVPRERPSTPPLPNSRQTAIGALAGNLRDTKAGICVFWVLSGFRRVNSPRQIKQNMCESMFVLFFFFDVEFFSIGNWKLHCGLHLCVQINPLAWSRRPIRGSRHLTLAMVSPTTR